MKGTNQKAAKKKIKAKGGASKRNKRSALHSGNATYNAWMAQKAHRLPAGLPGTARGKHIPKDASCECGKCSNEKLGSDHPVLWFKGMSESKMALEYLGEGYFE